MPWLETVATDVREEHVLVWCWSCPHCGRANESRRSPSAKKAVTGRCGSCHKETWITSAAKTRRSRR